MVKPLLLTVLLVAFLLCRQGARGHGMHHHDEFEEHDHSSALSADRDLIGDDGKPLEQNIEFTDRRTGKKQKGVRCASVHSEHDETRMLRRPDVRRLQVPTTPVNIAVKIHVITNTTGFGAVSDQRILNQMAVLNATFASSMFSFTMDPAVDIIRHVDDLYFTACYTQKDTMKPMWGVDVSNYMNVYICQPDKNILGHSTFPSSFNGNQNDTRHGVIVYWGSLPGGSASNYNLGITLTHETGHYLGLQHVFNGGCAASPTAGDFVADTPAQTATGGCPVGKDSCPTLNGTDDIRNFMDYSYDACMNHFTPGQVARMHSETSFFRTNLYY